MVFKTETINTFILLQLNKDDITSLLVIKEDGNQEGFFKEQLAKHDERIAIIRQNLSAQDNIIL